MEPKHSTLVQAALIALVIAIMTVGHQVEQNKTSVAAKAQTAMVE